MFPFLSANYHYSCLLLLRSGPCNSTSSYLTLFLSLCITFSPLSSLLFTDYEGIDGLFFAGTSGRLLMKSEDRVVLYDQQARKVIAELQVREGSTAQINAIQLLEMIGIELSGLSIS